MLAGAFWIIITDVEGQKSLRLKEVAVAILSKKNNDPTLKTNRWPQAGSFLQTSIQMQKTNNTLPAALPPSPESWGAQATDDRQSRQKINW